MTKSTTSWQGYIANNAASYVLRYLSNELQVSLVCLGVREAVGDIRGDVQLARRLDEHHLPNWRDDAEFSNMIQTLIAAMPLAKKTNLKVKSLKQTLAMTGGVTSRIFALVKDLSIDAIVTGEECISDDAIAKWTPVWSRHAKTQRRLRRSGRHVQPLPKTVPQLRTNSFRVGCPDWPHPITAGFRTYWHSSKSALGMLPHGL